MYCIKKYKIVNFYPWSNNDECIKKKHENSVKRTQL